MEKAQAEGATEQALGPLFKPCTQTHGGTGAVLTLRVNQRLLTILAIILTDKKKRYEL